MGVEIERKFLVKNTDYREMAVSAVSIKQGYLSRDINATVRVRVRGDEGFITVKSRNEGCVRREWEYAIPVDDASAMFALCQGRVLEKTRYIVPFEGLTWEIDEFHGAHEGLIVAEVELPSAEHPVIFPDFIGGEVTSDPRYYNSSMV